MKYSKPYMDFDLQPKLRGKLIEARPLTREDFPSLFDVASDPLLWEQHPEPTRYQREVFEGWFEKAMESKGALAAIDLKSGRIIGSSRYYGYDPAAREVKIGYTFIGREFWGKSYNPELKALMLDHAFQFVDRVLFEVGECNVRSQKAMQNIGARPVGKVDLPNVDGTKRPHVVFVIERNAR
jgi:N-acetyltransferase